MIIKLTPTKVCVEIDSLNELEGAFLTKYIHDTPLECRWDPKDSNSFEITGKADKLYKVLLDFSYEFDIEII